jgi:hypothetical protein
MSGQSQPYSVNQSRNAVWRVKTIFLSFAVAAANISFKYDSDEEEDDEFELHDNSLENGEHVPAHDSELDIK